MVPHSWLIYVLKLYKINTNIIDVCEHLMARWKTRLKIQTVTTGLIQIKRGVFQGDSLSPLWFCLALNPLSTLLNDTGYGFEIKQNNESFRVSHLLYMDDIKAYAGTSKHLEYLLKIIESFSTEIKMEFGIDKCRTVNIIRGKLNKGPNFATQDGNCIESMDDNDIYKYLGFQQTKVINHTSTKTDLQSQFQSRLKAVLKSGLNSKNLSTSINMFAIPIITYSAGIIK